MGNLSPFPMLSHRAITTLVQTGAGLSIVGLGVSLLALGYDHIMYASAHALRAALLSFGANGLMGRARFGLHTRGLLIPSSARST